MHPFARDLNRIYTATLFFAVHYVLTIYINSSFLSGIVGEDRVGFLYAAGSLLGIIILAILPSILQRIGNRAGMAVAVMVEMAALAVMAASPHSTVVIGAFILHHAIIPVMYFHFSIFIQHYSKHNQAGSARGMFLTIINSMFVAIPLLSGLLLSATDFVSVYALSALMTLPMLAGILSVQHFKDSHYGNHSILSGVRIAIKNKSIGMIVMCNFILQMFFAAMVIYMPIYLRDIGFGWGEIGVMFTIMLLPFMLFEYPLGKLSDKYIGEKEILILGFIIITISTGLIPFMHTLSIVAWTILLFMTRVGASSVEIMAESYFFKMIRNGQAQLVSLWMSIASLSYVLVPVGISAALAVVSLSQVFFAIACITALGVVFASNIKDTL
jgi:MFS family permease